MRQFVKLAVAVLVITALVLSAFGCATEPAPTAAPAAPTAAAPAPAQPTKAPAPAPTTAAKPAEVIELKYHHHDPPTSYTAVNAHNAWAKMIEQKTNGKVKITVYPAETLGKAPTSLDMASNGIADIAWGIPGMFAGRFPATDLLGLPMVGAKTGEQSSKVMWEAYQTIPEIQKEWKDYHVLFLHGCAPHVMGVNKKVEKLEDLQGMRLRAMAGASLKYVQALGATPVTVPMPEIFEALQKGTIDGFTTEWAGIGMFKFDEVTKYVIEEPLYSNIFFLVMNQKKWDSLPEDVKKVFNEVSGSFGSTMYGKAWDEGVEIMREAGIKKGVETYKLSPEELARWKAKAPIVADDLAKAATDKGMDGPALVEKIKAIYAKYQ